MRFLQVSDGGLESLPKLFEAASALRRRSLGVWQAPAKKLREGAAKPLKQKARANLCAAHARASSDAQASAAFRFSLRPISLSFGDIRVQALLANREPGARHEILIIGKVNFAQAHHREDLARLDQMAPIGA